ncbi:TPA: hypothetical protein KMG78_003197 [Escherichia coli]|nr:hypothetical protein [Escherichia coli]HBE6120784.1 hypothetical protein [Escherichia coli]HBE6157041.1 hypothetical protein [Escherichia coli]HBE6179440.1 hypothetical protein [Escherichia coli]HBE6184049.1 hypothetical protein [Escherichia coli]
MKGHHYVSDTNKFIDLLKYFSKAFFSTREIADAVGLTIYQARGHLEVLQSSSVVKKVNSGRGSPGQWKLL